MARRDDDEDEKVVKIPQEVLELQHVLSTKSGRNVLRRVLDYTGLDSSTYHADAREHARSEGRRDAGIWLRDEIIAASPGDYLTMMKEQINGD